MMSIDLCSLNHRIQPHTTWWIWRGWPAANCQTAAACYLFLTRMVHWYTLLRTLKTPSFMRFCLCLAAFTPWFLCNYLSSSACHTPQFRTISTSQLDSSESCSCFSSTEKNLARNIINKKHHSIFKTKFIWHLGSKFKRKTTSLKHRKNLWQLKSALNFISLLLKLLWSSLLKKN